MKNLILILTLTVGCSMIALQVASAQAIIAAADSSIAELSLFSLQFDSKGKATQNLSGSNQFRNPYSNSKAFSPDSTYPKIKIFVPETALTASTPVFKPERVDPGIFVPVSNCTEPESQD